MDGIIIEIAKCNNGFWYSDKIGQVFLVKEYPYLAADNGVTTYCNCIECTIKRAGLELSKHYEVINGEFKGSIIKTYDCEILWAQHNK